MGFFSTMASGMGSMYASSAASQAAQDSATNIEGQDSMDSTEDNLKLTELESLENIMKAGASAEKNASTAIS